MLSMFSVGDFVWNRELQNRVIPRREENLRTTNLEAVSKEQIAGLQTAIKLCIFLSITISTYFGFYVS